MQLARRRVVLKGSQREVLDEVLRDLRLSTISVRVLYAFCTRFVRGLYANFRTSVRSRYDLSTLFVRWFAYISTISDEDAFYKVHTYVAEKGIRLSP